MSEKRKPRHKNTHKPNLFIYGVLRIICRWLSYKRFGTVYRRNELRGKRGPIVVIANHQAAFDFVNLVRATNKKINIVASNSFYQTLPIKKMMDMVGIIPKQQFQTTLSDMRAMKSVVENDGILGIYPAGLMCEDGLSTPIPEATYAFLKWMRSDVYVIRSYGTYFCTPKWSEKRRRGRTVADVYRLFAKEELEGLDVEQIRCRTEEALAFDAYRENDELKIEYEGGDDIEGLENVLYVCPHCGREFTMSVRDVNTIYCTECGYEEKSDKCGMLTRTGEVGEEIRYVSDWARMVLEREIERVRAGEDVTLDYEADFYVVNKYKKKFEKTAEGRVVLNREFFILKGEGDLPVNVKVAASSFPSLPFSPGKYIEVQDGSDIYRCVFRDGKIAMKYINVLKALHAAKTFATEQK